MDYKVTPENIGMNKATRTIPIFIDLLANSKESIKIEELIFIKIEKDKKEIEKRYFSIQPFMTDEFYEWEEAYDELKLLFSMGYYRGAIAVVGLMSEAFIDNVYEKVRIINQQGNICNNKNLFGDKISADRKLKIIYQLKSISKQHYDILNNIRKARNKVLHNKKIDIDEIMVEKLMNGFIVIINDRFNSKYGVRRGQIYEKTKVKYSMKEFKCNVDFLNFDWQ